MFLATTMLIIEEYQFFYAVVVTCPSGQLIIKYL